MKRKITGALCALAVACAVETETETAVQSARPCFSEPAPDVITNILGITSYEFALRTIDEPAVVVKLTSNTGAPRELTLEPFFNGGARFLLGNAELDTFAIDNRQWTNVRVGGVTIRRESVVASDGAESSVTYSVGQLTTREPQELESFGARSVLESSDARALVALGMLGELAHGVAGLANTLESSKLHPLDDNPTATSHPTWMDVACQNPTLSVGLGSVAVTTSCGSCAAALRLGSGSTLAQFLGAMLTCPACAGASAYAIKTLLHCWEAFASAKTDAACFVACSTFNDFPGAGGKWNGLLRGCECGCDDKLCSNQTPRDPAIQYCGKATCQSGAPDACKVPASQICGDGRRDAIAGCVAEVCDSLDGCDSSTACNTTCSACVPKPSACGNGVLDLGESCDGSLGCPLGQRCDGTCSVCLQNTCGNGRIDFDEICDGQLGCSGQTFCRVDCAGCASNCGNSYVDPGEACDGNRGCDGNTRCAPDCSACNPPRCGDGIVDPGEACEFGTCGGSAECKLDCSGCQQNLPDDCRIIINFAHPERKQEHVLLFLGGTCAERDAGTKQMVVVGIYTPDNSIVKGVQCGIYGLRYYIETGMHETADPNSKLTCIDVPVQSVNSQPVTVTD